MAQNNNRKSTNLRASDNPIEVIKNTGSDVGQTLANEAQNTTGQILRAVGEVVGLAPQRSNHGEIEVKEQSSEILFGEKIEQNAVAETQFRQIKETRLWTYRDTETAREINELLEALKREVLAAQKISQSFLGDVAKITVEQAPAKTGVYHLNLLTWLLSLVREIREDLNLASTWLSAHNNKKAKGYWGMFKKHGTGFAMSGERAIASSVG